MGCWSIELESWRGLFDAHATGDDLRDRKVLRPNRRVRESPEHHELAHVGQRIGHGALQELLGARAERMVAREEVVEASEGGEETGRFFLPRSWRHDAPALLSLGHRERPV